MTFARFNPCTPCCSPIECTCSKYKMEAKMEYGEIFLNRGDHNHYLGYPNDVLNLYAKDLVDGSVCWRGNPETTTLIWSQVDTDDPFNHYQIIQSKEFTDVHNGFIAWWNQPTDDYPQVPESGVFEFDVVNTMKFYFQDGSGTCVEYICNRPLPNLSPYFTSHNSFGLCGGAGALNFYYTGYGTGDTLDPTFPSYYYYSTINCSLPEDCCISAENLYLVLASNSTFSCIPGTTSILLTKSEDKWIGEANDIIFQLSQCSSRVENLLLELYCDNLLLYTSRPTYPCGYDDFCSGCDDEIRGGVIGVDTADNTHWFGRTCCSPDPPELLYLYPSKYEDAVVECNCLKPINRILYASFSNVSSPCELGEDLIVELKLISGGYQVFSFGGTPSEYVWTNLHDPLILPGAKYLFYLSSEYRWQNTRVDDEYVGFACRHVQYWRLYIEVSDIEGCNESPLFLSCDCTNYAQIFELSCTPPAPNCDPFQLVYDVDLGDYSNFVFTGHSKPCPVCNTFTINITE